MTTVSPGLRESILGKVLLGADFVSPEVWLSLHTADPGAAGDNEVRGGSYKRLRVFFAVGRGYVQNNSSLEYRAMPPASISHIGLWNQEAGGAFLFGGPVKEAKTLNGGDTFRVVAGDLVIRA
jgi:hypothetical protein